MTNAAEQHNTSSTFGIQEPHVTRTTHFCQKPGLTDPPEPEPRTIGRFGALAIVMGSMLGIGIFLTPRIVAQSIQSPSWFLGIWAIGGLIALSGAVAYAELGACFPKAGGDYVFLREAFGNATAFASGWLLFAGVFVGSIATVAVPIFQYQVPVILAPLTAIDTGVPWIGPFTGAQVGAVILILALTGINVAGTRLATCLQLLLILIPTIALLGGALWAFGSAPHETAVAAGASSTFSGSPVAAITTALLAIYFSYSGWNAVGYVGGEVQQPGRTIPVALIGGTLLITALYLVICTAYVVVLDIGGLTTAYEAGSVTAAALGGPALSWTMSVLICLALVGSLNATILTGARIARAMAQDSVLFPAIGKLHVTRKTPYRALLLQGTLAILLVLSGTFDRLIELTSVAMLVMGSLTVCALFVLRRRSDLPRPYRAAGYPWLPAFYLIVSIAIISTRLWEVFFPQTGTELSHRWFPVIGLGIFLGALITYRLKPFFRAREAS